MYQVHEAKPAAAGLQPVRRSTGHPAPAGVRGTWADQVLAGAGNQRMQRLLQAKLAVSAPGDRYEQEADRLAEAVLRVPDPRPSSISAVSTRPSLSLTQRVCCDACAVPPLSSDTMRAGNPRERLTPGQEAQVSETTADGGQLLGAWTRAFFETRFQRDFSDVRVHSDSRAAESARAIGALAYTVGTHIVFDAGRFAPGTAEGRQLLAHELVHTVQQKGWQESPGVLMGRWDPSGSDCSGEPTGKWIERIVVEQESPQSVTLHWSDGSLDADACSTGKGHCCVDTGTPDGVACGVRESNRAGTNCTPITQGEGLPVVHRDRDHKGIDFWTEFDPSPRYIALHTYSPVDGTALSHGCVRLRLETARKIYCGARQNETMVQVRGFARPMCDTPSLQNEWVKDFRTAGESPDGEPSSYAQHIRQTRRELRAALGMNERQLLDLTSRLGRETQQFAATTGVDQARTRSRVAEEIPRCGTTAPLPTLEEARLTTKVGSAGSIPAQILAASQFELRLTPFTLALSRSRDVKAAQRIVLWHGLALWQAATRRAQTSGGGVTDDRPLYWARLQMARALRQWQPRFLLTTDKRQQLLDAFELASRGMTSAPLRAAAGVKRILISGFDPFALNNAVDIVRGNPSGAAILALDGTRLSSGGATALIEGVILPVRFSAFDLGMVEAFFGPYMSRAIPPDMIMTISEGSSREFEVEEFAGRRRASGSFTDNLARTGGGSIASPVVPPGLAPGPEFLRTTLPTSAMRGALGRPGPSTQETEITEIPARGGGAVRRPVGGPTARSTAVAGSGGGFLSNEIFYRTSLVRLRANAAIPVGHLHTPQLDPSAGGITSTQFVTTRDFIVRMVKRLIESALPSI